MAQKEQLLQKKLKTTNAPAEVEAIRRRIWAVEGELEV